MNGDPDNDYEAALSDWARSQPGAAHARAPLAPETDNDEDDLFGSDAPSGEQAAAIERVAGWTRERFKLTAADVVTVAEVACALPGCPPLETVVAFWTGPDKRHHFKLFKPVAEIAYDDLPFAWLKDTLLVPDGFGCECC
jgi:nitrate reductase delta subunit